MTRERLGPIRRSSLLLLFATVVAGHSFIPAHARSNPVIWEGDDQSVFLAPQDDSAASPNDHPATLTEEDIRTMLSSLHIRYADEASEARSVAVFNEEQVQILGEALAVGLAAAGPSQDVNFSVVGAHRMSPGAFARRNRLTAGRVFFKAGKLNVIFGEIQSPYRKKNIYGRIEEDFYPRRYGDRESAGDHEVVLLAHPSGDTPAASAKRSDWVAFDPDAAGTRLLPETAAKSGAAETGAPAPAAPLASDPSGASVEQRLETLKRLRDRELISEEAYRAKVDQILRDL